MPPQTLALSFLASIIILLMLARAMPAPSALTYLVFRAALALSSAGVAATIPGSIELKLEPTTQVVIQTTGTIALFFIVYFFNPAKLVITPSPEITPDTPPSVATPPEITPDNPLSVATLRVQDDGPALSLLDVTVINRGPVDVIVHRVVLRILEARTITLGAHPRYLPSTHQYNANIGIDDESTSIETSQLVPARGVDRFQLTYVLGADDASDSPWGSAGVAWITGADGTKVTQIRTRAQLELNYNEDQTYLSDPFSFSIHSPGFGFKARQIAGTDLESKLTTLASVDVNVVESLVAQLATIGGPEVLSALQELQATDHAYLADHYAEVFRRTENPRYWDLPPVSERMSRFRTTLADAITHVKETTKLN